MSGTCCHLMRRRTMRQQKGKVWYQCKGTSSSLFWSKGQRACGELCISTRTYVPSCLWERVYQYWDKGHVRAKPTTGRAFLWTHAVSSCLWGSDVPGIVLGGQEWREEAGHTGTMPQAPTQQPGCCHSLQSDEIVIQHSEFHTFTSPVTGLQTSKFGNVYVLPPLANLYPLKVANSL